MEGGKECFSKGQHALVSCVGSLGRWWAAVLCWTTDCGALLQGQRVLDADWQLWCWGSTGEEVKELCDV
jgi:hypothetical protein